MTSANDPVTPHLTYNETSGHANGFMEGLTKREYFAILITQSLVSTTTVRRSSLWSKIKIFFGHNGWKMNYDYHGHKVCKSAVETADMLIEALNNNQPKNNNQ